MTWYKAGRTVGPEGTTVTYRSDDTALYIESRKRHVPHANGIGTWDHTSFVVLANGHEIVTKNTLTAAKAFVEKGGK